MAIRGQGVDALERVEILSRPALREWLQAHHLQPAGVWLVTWKKRHADRHVPWDDVVVECLCFGWIDGRARALDADRSQILIGPRRAGSAWSRRNKEHVARLEAAGLLAPAGLAVIARAKADGSWTFLDDVEDLVRPPDLDLALAGADLLAAWEAVPRSLRRAGLDQLKRTRGPAARERRIAACLALAGARR